MSTIAVVLSGTAIDAGSWTALRNLTGRSLSDLRERSSNGRPIAEFELFGNDHDEVEEKLLRLLTEILEVRLFELRPGERYEECSQHVSEITPQVLRNILAEHRLEIARQVGEV